MAIAEAAPAPEFTLQSSGGPVSLRGLRGKKVVLYFYPKDNTPGCTQEACDFRDRFPKVKSANAVVLGVSKDSLGSHDKFASKFELPFTLLSDPDSAVAKQYGAFGKKLMYGKPVVGTIRSTVLIDEQGRVARIWSPVKVAGHAEEVLAAVEGRAEAPAPKKPAAKKPAPKKPAPKKPAAKPAKRAKR